MSRSGSLAVTVLLAGELSEPSRNLDLLEIQTRAHAADSQVRVAIVPDLRNHFEEIIPVAVASGADRLVLGLHTADVPTATLQLESRKAGLDPLGIEVLNFGAYPATGQSRIDVAEWATTLILGAVARARAFPGSQPESLRPFMPKHLSRRALFSLPVLEYRAMPTIDRDRCRAAEGCRQCERACPHEAVVNVDGVLRLEKTQCTSCGRCVTACPQEAIDIPGSTVDQIHSQIAAMLQRARTNGARPHGVIYHCLNSARALERHARDHGVSLAPNWLPVTVPCLGMITSQWLLAPLTLGATAVAVLPCDNNCRSGQPGLIEEQVQFSVEFLRRLGETDERVFVLPTNGTGLVSALRDFPATGPPAAHMPLRANPLAHRSRALVLLGLSDSHQPDRVVSLEHPQSPFGIVSATEGCTLCGACASACPTRALDIEETDAGISLTFDSTACVACQQCLPVCPEHDVLHMRPSTDLQTLAAGRAVLRSDSFRHCEMCGKPIASMAMSRRVAALLDDEFASTVDVISRYCVDCRGLLS
jgi:formate hydrogenlyase subunit 6/NADH:ubiquinone oxidoreductase subunit I